MVKLTKEFTRPTIYNTLEKTGNFNHKKIDFYFEKSDENKDMSDLVKTNVTNDGAKAPSTTSFLGVVIDTENGSSNPKIRKALDKSFILLDIMKFIEVTKFKLNMTMFDYFWQVVVGNQYVHLSSLVLDWFGYPFKVQPTQMCARAHTFKSVLTLKAYLSSPKGLKGI
jgi:hypothetical protein